MQLMHEIDSEQQPERYRMVHERYEQLRAMRDDLRAMIGEKPKAYPTVLHALALMAIVIGVQFGVYSLIASLSQSLSASWLRRDAALVAISNLAAFSAALALGLIHKKASPKDALGLRPFRPAMLIPTVLTLSGMMILISELDNLLRHFFPPPEMFEQTIANLLQGGVAAIIALLVIAPLTEELFFRGLVLQGFTQNYGPRRAIVYSALLFALIHLNIYQFVGTFAAGILLGWLRIATGSVWPGVVGHFVNNGALILIMRSGTDIPGVIQKQTPEFQPLWLNSAGALLFLLGLLLFRFLEHKKADSAV